MNWWVADADRRKDRGVRPDRAQGRINMKPKNAICLWFDKDAHEAARFYALTFPDSNVIAVHEAPSIRAARRAMC
jgi:hypothetical protein